MTIESRVERAVTAVPAELTAAEMILRRLMRPQTYVQAGYALANRAIHWPKIDRVVRQRAEHRGSDFRLVQIGANDGRRADPVNRYLQAMPWQALLVEPVPRYFDALRANYAGRPDTVFVRAAVSIAVGSAIMRAVHPNNDQLSRLQGSSTLHPEVLESAAWVVHDVEAVCEDIEAPTTTLGRLLQEHDVDSVDYLVVDAEGHDGVVVGQALDLDAQPAMILYEHMHLPAREQGQLLDRLHGSGYGTVRLRRDTFAWQDPATVAV